MMAAGRTPRRGLMGGFFASMRVRKKLMFLHTCFSLALAIILLIALRPAIHEIIRRAELSKARTALLIMDPNRLPGRSEDTGEVTIRSGTADVLAITPEVARAARAAPGVPVIADGTGSGARMVKYVPQGQGGLYIAAEAVIPEARAAVLRLYGLMVLALLGVYALVAGALEVFVLPQHVYGPIRRILAADRAAREGQTEDEIIPESAIGRDELGEITRSRNEVIHSLRRHERALAEALGELERVATDLRRKNHLLETARRNMADTDRLVSLGMMSAGIAHELNTPLTVATGLVDKLRREEELAPSEIALLARVMKRLEGLGESLLDFARARTGRRRPAQLRAIVEEAWMLVRLDRGAAEAMLINDADPKLEVPCDADRMVQVFVNLLRNAVDAGSEAIRVSAETETRDGSSWASMTITDEGPGIEPELLSSLFEPFVSTRLDARGTGLGLAVAEGIVREHGGVILARNREDRAGAVFEIMLPVDEPAVKDEA